MKKILIAAVVALSVGSCSKKMSSAKTNSAINTKVVPAIKQEEVSIKNSIAVPVVSVAHGQATYTTKCGRCHGLKTTTDYTAERWVGIMQSMAPKARLDETEKANVLAYVQANAKK